MEVLAELDPAAYELPEGLAVRDDRLYLGFALTGAVESFGLSGAGREAFATFPPPPPNTSFLTGLTFDDAGALYGAYVSFTTDAQAGIYRAPAGGGAATLWASDASMVFPNGLAFDAEGVLYVTDSAAGAILRVDGDGTVEPWLVDAALAPDATACGQDAAVPVGANGIAFDGEAFYVASNDQALLARIPRLADGSAGPLEIVAGPDCDGLGGIDGITFDRDGSVLAAINRQNKIVRITSDGSVSTLAQGSPLDFPATLELVGAGDERALYVTSFALGALLAGGEPQPALVKVTGF